MSIFPTKILLDTDSSQNAQLARTTAVDMATTTDSELHVVSVAPSLPSYDGYHCHDVRIPEVVEQLRKRAQIILDEQVQKIERDGGKVTQKHLKIAKLIGERYRAQQILRVAEDIDAGLIVMGTRGRGECGELLWAASVTLWFVTPTARCWWSVQRRNRQRRVARTS